jgi:hypothetical protein
MKDPNIKIPIGFATIEYTPEEIAKEILDFHLLKEAFLVLLNPEATQDSDILWSREEALYHARRIYNDTYWNGEFIDRCFNPQK